MPDPSVAVAPPPVADLRAICAALYEAMKTVTPELLAASTSHEKELLSLLHSQLSTTHTAAHVLLMYRADQAEVAAKPVVEQFRCSYIYRDFGGSTCDWDASYVTPDGRRYCEHHAPDDVDLSISEHDDQRVPG